MLDSNVLITALDSSGGEWREETSRKLLAFTQRDCWISAIALAEIGRLFETVGLMDSCPEVLELLERMFSVAPADCATVRQALLVGRPAGCWRNALQLACAMHTGCGLLVSSDIRPGIYGAVRVEDMFHVEHALEG